MHTTHIHIVVGGCKKGINAANGIPIIHMLPWSWDFRAVFLKFRVGRGGNWLFSICSSRSICVKAATSAGAPLNPTCETTSQIWPISFRSLEKSYLWIYTIYIYILYLIIYLLCIYYIFTVYVYIYIYTISSHLFTVYLLYIHCICIYIYIYMCIYYIFTAYVHIYTYT